MRRLRRSRLAKKKSPTSVSPRSIYSTRKTREPRAAPCRWPGVADAVAVEAAEAAEAAVAAVAVAADPAARPGAFAASANPKQFPDTLTNTRRQGRVRQGRPGRFVSSVPQDDLQWRLAAISK